MNKNENDAIKEIPEKFKPLTAWQYFWHGILYAIPLIGTICLIIHAISDKNINRRSYARSFFCGIILVLIIIAILIAVLGGFGSLTSVFDNISNS